MENSTKVGREDWREKRRNKLVYSEVVENR